MDAEAIQARLRQFDVLCRQRGLPRTIQRREVFRNVLERDDHPTADLVYEAVKARVPTVSRTTVYRVLDGLVRMGMIRRVSFTGSAARFDGNVQQHHHLVCRVCGAVVDVKDKGGIRVGRLPAECQGFRIQGYSLYLLGVCAACRKAGP